MTVRGADCATSWTVEESQFDFRQMIALCSPKRPNCFWGPPIILFKGFRVFLSAGLNSHSIKVVIPKLGYAYLQGYKPELLGVREKI